MSLTAQPTPLGKTPSGKVSGVALLKWTAVALIVTGGVLSGLMVIVDRVEWWRGFIGASVIAFPAAALGLFPLLLVAARGTAAQISFGFLAGTFLRVIAAFSLLLVATSLYGMPKLPTAVLTMVYYFAVLGVEVGVLVLQMRRAFPMTKAGPTLAA